MMPGTQIFAERTPAASGGGRRDAGASVEHAPEAFGGALQAVRWGQVHRPGVTEEGSGEGSTAREGVDGRHGSDQGEGSGETFDLLMVGVQRRLALAEGLRQEGEASPQQMFEADPVDGRGQRKAVMKAAFQADQAGPRNAARLDGSLQVTPAAGKGMGVEAAAAQPVVETAVQDVGRVAGEMSKNSQTATQGNPRLEATLGETARVSESAGMPRSVPDARAAGSASSAATSPSAMPTVHVGPAVPVAGAKMAARETVAEQVGRLLSGPRGGEGEAARALGSKAADGAGRQIESGDSRQGSPIGKKAQAAPGAETQRAEPGNFERLVRSIRWQLGAERSTARLHLHPPELGHVRVDVRVTGGQVEIAVQTQTREATDLLTHRAAALRTALEQHGLVVDRFEIQQQSGNPATNDVGHRQEQTTGGATSGDGERTASRGSGHEVSGEPAGEDEWVDATAWWSDAERRIDVRI